MLRSIAPTQFVTSGTFVSPTVSAAIDGLDCFHIVDHEVDPRGPEILCHHIARTDDAHHAKPQVALWRPVRSDWQMRPRHRCLRFAVARVASVRRIPQA